MILDRTTTPKFKKIEKLDIIQAEQKMLDNKMPVYVINADAQGLLRIEFVFEAGIWEQKKPLVAYVTSQLLEEGTKKLSASEIADGIDNFGAFLETEISQDYAYVTLYVLGKHLKSVLPVVEDVLKNPTFPENEFKTFIQNKKQKLLVDEKKVNHIARKKFKQLLFGNETPYGYYTSVTDYDNLKRDQLIDFHKLFYASNNCKLILAGNITQDIIDVLNSFFGGNDWSSVEKANSTKSIANTRQEESKHLIVQKDALQSAIRLGKVLFNKTHPDYFAMQVLNTVLGGYFGSRLMANIREDKGYTYGISSSIVSLKRSGYFVISSEVGADVCSKAIDEIYFEIKRLQDELIPEEELERVKNYLLGIFMRSIDGPFALVDKLKGIMEYELDYNYYQNYINTIKNVSSKELKDLANKYLKQDSLIELVVGAK